MRPKPPPKYRILMMLASPTCRTRWTRRSCARAASTASTRSATRPRPAGSAPTRGTSTRCRNEVTAEQIDKLATMTPYATGATIKDLVNESLITAVRDGRDVVTWPDVIRAKQLKAARAAGGRGVHRARAARGRRARGVPRDHRLPDPPAPRDRHRHDREGQQLPRHGRRASSPTTQFTQWRSEYESDILVSLASLAGERMFFEEDSSSGRVERPAAGDDRSVPDGGLLGDGIHRLVPGGQPDAPGRHARRRQAGRTAARTRSSRPGRRSLTGSRRT